MPLSDSVQPHLICVLSLVDRGILVSTQTQSDVRRESEGKLRGGGDCDIKSTLIWLCCISEQIAKTAQTNANRSCGTGPLGIQQWD